MGGVFLNDCFLICGFFLGTDSLVFVGWVDIGHCLGFFAPILSAARASAHVLYCLVHGVSTLLYLSNIACIAVIFLCNLEALYYLWKGISLWSICKVTFIFSFLVIIFLSHLLEVWFHLTEHLAVHTLVDVLSVSGEIVGSKSTITDRFS